MILLQPVSRKFGMCISSMCIMYLLCTHNFISLPIVLFGAGLIIMMPFDQLLLPGLAACKV